MTPKMTEAVSTELKKLAQELNLSDAQKEQLRAQLAETYAKLQDLTQQNPNIASSALAQRITSIRGSMRERLVKFLTPQQLEKWDSQVAKAKQFLGHTITG